MREVRQGHVAAESCGGDNSHDAGAGAELEDPEAAVERGGERAGGRVGAVAIEEGDEGGGGGPELEGEALGR